MYNQSNVSMILGTKILCISQNNVKMKINVVSVFSVSFYLHQSPLTCINIHALWRNFLKVERVFPLKKLSRMVHVDSLGFTPAGLPYYNIHLSIWSF